MIELKFTVPSVVPKAVLKTHLEGIAATAIALIRREAQMQIRSQDLKNLYMNSLDPKKYSRVVEITDTKAIVTLVSPPTGLDPNALELGSGPWDMKPKLLKGAAYKDINIRHGHPESKGGHFKPIPKDIFAGMIANIKQAGGKRSGGVAGVMGPPLERVGGPPQGKPAGPNTHKTSIYSGMLKMGAQYEKAKGTQYVTIRRVSAKSDSKSWIHPGWKPMLLFDRVQPALEKELKKRSAELVKAFMGL